MAEVVLHDYWRSSASYRLRIALGLLGIEYRTVPVDLLKQGHKSPEFLKYNPQGLVPALEIDGLILTQSVAILEYLDETRPGYGLLPSDSIGRHRVRALSHVIAMDIHPICNLGVVRNIMDIATTHGEDANVARSEWMAKYIGSGLAGFEAMLVQSPTGDFCHGDRPGMADLCLIPQLYNADRWGVDTSGFHKINVIAERCSAIAAFENAHPDKCPQ